MMLSFVQNGFKPREARRSVMIAARMRSGSSWSDVCIRNVSSRGLLLSAEMAPSVGTYVEIRRGSMAIIGRIAWNKAPFFGLRAQDRIEINHLISEPRLKARPNFTPSTASDGDRRASDRKRVNASTEQQLERSRCISSALEFGLLIVVALVIAGIAATEVYNVLAKPFAVVTNKL